MKESEEMKKRTEAKIKINACYSNFASDPSSKNRNKNLIKNWDSARSG